MGRYTTMSMRERTKRRTKRERETEESEEMAVAKRVR